MNSLTMFPVRRKIGMGMRYPVYEETAFCRCGCEMKYITGGSDGWASWSSLVCPNSRGWNHWFHYSIRGGTEEERP